MSNKFLKDNTSSETVEVEGLSIDDLEANLPIKTDASKRLYSSRLFISDTLGLQDVLDSMIVNPLNQTLDADSNKIINLATPVDPGDATTKAYVDGRDTGLVTIHSDVDSAGSGSIITTVERTQIETNKTNIATVVGNVQNITSSLDNTEFSGFITSENIVPSVDGAYSIGTELLRYSDLNLTGDIKVNNESVGFVKTEVRTDTPALSTFVGISAGNAGVVSGGENTALGHNALPVLSTGFNNTAIGYNAGNNIETGSFNTMLGHGASAAQENAINAIAIGRNAVAPSKHCVIGNSAIVRIMSGAPNDCDLGAANTRFKDLYLAGNIDMHGVLQVDDEPVDFGLDVVCIS